MVAVAVGVWSLRARRRKGASRAPRRAAPAAAQAARGAAASKEAAAAPRTAAGAVESTAPAWLQGPAAQRTAVRPLTGGLAATRRKKSRPREAEMAANKGLTEDDAHHTCSNTSSHTATDLPIDLWILILLLMICYYARITHKHGIQMNCVAIVSDCDIHLHIQTRSAGGAGAVLR